MKVRTLGALLALSMAIAFGTTSSRESVQQVELAAAKTNTNDEHRHQPQARAGEARSRSSAADVARWVSDELKRKVEDALRDAPVSDVGVDWGKANYAAVLALPPPHDPRTSSKRSERAPDPALSLDEAERTNANTLSIRTKQIEGVYERLYAASASLPEPHRTRRLDYLLHRIAGHEDLPATALDVEQVAAAEEARLARILEEEKIP